MNQEVSAKTGDLLPMLEGITDDKAPELIWPITSLENLKKLNPLNLSKVHKNLFCSLLLGGRTSLVKNLFRAG